ncbi:MAG: hypothetical protein HC847_20670 [Hydrococcus sp. RU_2_2]|jgi:hypothetical protein|nr:hypothetical protein [Hydrococcus sp. RU_2_2]NJP22100.1 hypothetical protein [Hydrococcus sp. CRU_1_1]NJQ97567.1 hypothetical protein [Hydrococcus sp. CSU_1_8]
MIGQNDWACLSVQNFFSNLNWQGTPQKECVENQFSETSWLCLTVEEFFSNNNWRGQPRIVKKDLQGVFSLTLSVQEFFQCIDWEETPQIGHTSQPKTAHLPIVVSSRDFSLNHLSNLF